MTQRQGSTVHSIIAISFTGGVPGRSAGQCGYSRSRVETHEMEPLLAYSGIGTKDDRIRVENQRRDGPNNFEQSQLFGLRQSAGSARGGKSPSCLGDSRPSWASLVGLVTLDKPMLFTSRRFALGAA